VRVSKRSSRTEGSSRHRRFAATGWRLRVVLVVALLALGVGATAAYGALGPNDTATGTGALANEADGNGNTADGYQALLNNTTGNGNTAAGLFALSSNTTGGVNTAAGAGALNRNTTAQQEHRRG
jgi:hypothetical protein